MITHSQPSAGTTTLSETDFTAPIDDRYFEDYAAGAIYEYGHVTVTEEDIIEFARRWDPQPIHTDPAFAVDGPFGGIIASGWHSGGILMQLFVAHYLSRVASLASPGIDELRWPIPVRPGDVLRLRTTIAEARPSRSKPDRGLVHTKAELFNQNDQCVVHLLPINILRRRKFAD
ncbi:MAG: MaoC family dehydratase [Acidimicrobiales bacterium]